MKDNLLHIVSTVGLGKQYLELYKQRRCSIFVIQTYGNIFCLFHPKSQTIFCNVCMQTAFSKRKIMFINVYVNYE